jgi:ABC-type transport system substrate-binding protein
MGAGVLEPKDLKEIQTDYTTKFQVFLGPPIQNRVIIMNANKAPTDDLTFRKVVMHAVNKAAIIDKELYGFAEPVDTLFPKNAPFCGLDLTPRWDYDIEKAKLLRCWSPATVNVSVPFPVPVPVPVPVPAPAPVNSTAPAPAPVPECAPVSSCFCPCPCFLTMMVWLWASSLPSLP